MNHYKQPHRAINSARRGYSRLASFTGAAFLAIVAGVSAPAAMAQAPYPSKPVRIVLGFSAGGGTDAIARGLAKHMTGTLGANVFIDNKPGANGNIAAEEVSRAARDGYTLLYNTSSIASSPALYSKRLSYDVSKDLTPIALTASLPIVLVVPLKSPFKTVEELVAYAKANPGKLNYASAGNGNVTHLASLSFEDAVGIKGTQYSLQRRSACAGRLDGRHGRLLLCDIGGRYPSRQVGTSEGVGGCDEGAT